MGKPGKTMKCRRGRVLARRKCSLVVKSPRFAPCDTRFKNHRGCLSSAAWGVQCTQVWGPERKACLLAQLGPSFCPGEPGLPGSSWHSPRAHPAAGEGSPARQAPTSRQMVRRAGLGGGAEEAGGGEGERSEERSNHRSCRPEAAADPGRNKALGAGAAPRAVGKD